MGGCFSKAKPNQKQPHPPQQNTHQHQQKPDTVPIESAVKQSKHLTLQDLNDMPQKNKEQREHINNKEEKIQSKNKEGKYMNGDRSVAMGKSAMAATLNNKIQNNNGSKNKYNSVLVDDSFGAPKTDKWAQHTEAKPIIRRGQPQNVEGNQPQRSKFTDLEHLIQQQQKFGGADLQNSKIPLQYSHAKNPVTMSAAKNNPYLSSGVNQINASSFPDKSKYSSKSIPSGSNIPVNVMPPTSNSRKDPSAIIQPTHSALYDSSAPKQSENRAIKSSMNGPPPTGSKLRGSMGQTGYRQTHSIFLEEPKNVDADSHSSVEHVDVRQTPQNLYDIKGQNQLQSKISPPASGMTGKFGNDSDQRRPLASGMNDSFKVQNDESSHRDKIAMQNHMRSMMQDSKLSIIEPIPSQPEEQINGLTWKSKVFKNGQK